MPPPRSLRVLFVVRRLKYLTYFKSSLELLCDRGHELLMLLEDDEHDVREAAWLESMSARANFSHLFEDQFANDLARRPAVRIRRAHEYLRLTEPRYEGRAHYRKRKSVLQSPTWIHTLESRGILDSRVAHRVVRSAVGILDRAMPLPARPAAFVREVGPDVVVVCDHGRPGSLHSAYVQACREQGIPVVIWVASWDNLTTRQLTRSVPDRMLVWNEWQVREAVELHGLPPAIVAATGAPSFDEWFSRRPSPAADFLDRIGLDPERPYILWVGGALFPATRTEPEFVRDWLQALRSSGDPQLGSIGVLLRPHPYRVDDWFATDFSDFENVVVHPGPDMTIPVDDDQRADYFDSIYHAAAVVGLNSSAMIEAAIIGRSVLAMIVPEFHDSQEGTFHFSYLLEANGGPVRTSATLEEHLGQLRQTLDGRDDALRRQSREFVERFVRPHGIGQPATPIAVDAIEELAQLPVTPRRDPVRVRLLRQAIGAWLQLGRLRGAARFRASRALRRPAA